MLSGAGAIAQGQTPTGQILLWVFVLIVVIVLGGLGVMALRRRLLSRDDGAGASGLMDEMRAMHARGELSDEEYDRVRKRMAARAAGRDPDEIAPAIRKETEPGVLRARPGYDLTGEPLPELGEGRMPGDRAIGRGPDGPGPGPETGNPPGGSGGGEPRSGDGSG
ncbi:MAG: hypothetical protein ACF8Q5_14805 [Phycisphaerales bacterium JB040]